MSVRCASFGRRRTLNRSGPKNSVSAGGGELAVGTSISYGSCWSGYLPASHSRVGNGMCSLHVHPTRRPHNTYAAMCRNSTRMASTAVMFATLDSATVPGGWRACSSTASNTFFSASSRLMYRFPQHPQQKQKQVQPQHCVGRTYIVATIRHGVRGAQHGETTTCVALTFGFRCTNPAGTTLCRLDTEKNL